MHVAYLLPGLKREGLISKLYGIDTPDFTYLTLNAAWLISTVTTEYKSPKAPLLPEFGIYEFIVLLVTVTKFVIQCRLQRRY